MIALLIILIAGGVLAWALGWLGDVVAWVMDGGPDDWGAL